MTSPLPPRLRDSRNLADLIRQNKRNARQLGVGFAGGRFPLAHPLGATALYGDVEDDEADDQELPAAINTDVAYATVAGQIVLNLTYVPIEGTLLVFWGSGDLHPSEYTLTGQTVTFTDRHIRVGHRLHAAYWYWPSDVPGAPGPATLALRGTSWDAQSNSIGLASLPLPLGTVAGSGVAGDLIVVTGNTDKVTVTDTRLTFVGNNTWIGWATNLTDIAATAPGGFGSSWAIACTTFDTNATAWTVALVNSMSGLSTLDIPAISGVAATVCGITDGHTTVSGSMGVPTGYTTGVSTAPSLVHARVDFWTSPDLGTSPTGPSSFSGGPGGAFATVIGLIGPED